jgi:RNA-directed DNA polymerase
MESSEGKMTETPSSIEISTKLQRIAKLAREAPDMVFTTLAHHIDLAWMREAYNRTRKDGAKGVDGQSAEEYATNLDENLKSLLDRAKSGTYRAPPVKRVHIPKGDGKQTRPIGIPTFEDKILQRAVHMLLSAIYEEEFWSFSYGFRVGRSAHQALEDLRNSIMDMRCEVILEVDIRSFFDTVIHNLIQEIVRKRVRDGVILRLIGKWLNAGVLEEKELWFPETGTPQGGVISPLLANIFLHEIVDGWFVRDVLPRLKGRAQLIRYADDMVFVFEREEDAKRVSDVLPKRFGKYGLTLHPEKTRLVSYRRPPRTPPTGGGKTGAETAGTFDFLGFTHYWGRSNKGNRVVKRRTAKDRFRRALRRVKEKCRLLRHEPLQAQRNKLAQRLHGHYQYFGITGNYAAIKRFLHEVIRTWRKWLSTRSHDGYVTWAMMTVLLARFPLPQPRIVHRYGT